jgi:hypothetical protein
LGYLVSVCVVCSVEVGEEDKLGVREHRERTCRGCGGVEMEVVYFHGRAGEGNDPIEVL